MTKISKNILLVCLIALLTGCSQILQTIDLKINVEDNALQEEFNVTQKTLTIKEAKAQKAAPYPREVLRTGRGEKAHPIPEKLVLKSEFPKNNSPNEYKIGIGDEVRFSRLIENNRSFIKKTSDWPKQKVAPNYKLGIGDTLALTVIKKSSDLNTSTSGTNGTGQNVIINSQQNDQTIVTNGRIGSDGSVLLLEVGRLDATGKSLNELRSEVRNILIRNGVSPRFQLEILEFKSQKSYLTVNSESRVLFLDDQKTTIKDILTSANVGIEPGIITRIRLQRNNNEFSISLRDLYSADTNNIDIQPGDHIFVENSSANIKVTSSIVDHEGKIIFENIGSVRAEGLSLNELKKKFEDLIQRLPDSQNAFQIEITNFASQSALISIQGGSGISIPITNTPVTLAQALTENGLSVDGNHITQISLKRKNNTFVFTLYELLDPNSPDIYVQPDDRLITTILPYKENKVFILGGVAPQIFKIYPKNRETLADVLFTGGGVLSAAGAKRSEVYLLRGTNPVVAFHLDAQSPTRLIVADAMELRPNDILYVAEQPISSFNRTLAAIVPLRILLRDIQAENIP